jgi:hypothetical protein
MENKNINTESIGNDHIVFSLETPLRDDAFKLDDELKIELIEKHFKEIMQILQDLFLASSMKAPLKLPLKSLSKSK